MKIVVVKEPELGVPVGKVTFGSVVRRASGDDGKTYYLVASAMDGTGNRQLITLGGGSWKYTPQTLRVVLVDAHVVIGAESEFPLPSKIQPGDIQWVPHAGRFDRCENCGYAK